MLKTYYKLNDESIVIEVTITSDSVDKSYIEYDGEDSDSLLGKKWNGSTFEEVPTEESYNVSRETSMSDLEDYCLTIIELLTDAKEGE